MRFSLISTLALAASVLAAPPQAVEVKRGNTVTNTLGSLTSILNTTVSGYTSDIESLVDGVSNSIVAQLRITADFAGIQAAVIKATTGIKLATTGAVGGISGVATGLTDAELLKLTQILGTTQGIIQNIAVSTNVTGTNLTPDLVALVVAEVKVVSAFLVALTNPLLAFSQAVQKAQVAVTGTVTGLSNASTGLNSIVTSLLTI